MLVLEQGTYGVLASQFGVESTQQPATCYDIRSAKATLTDVVVPNAFVTSALVLNDVDPQTFNADPESKKAVAASLVEAVSIITSEDQISNIRAKETTGRRLLAQETEILLRRLKFCSTSQS